MVSFTGTDFLFICAYFLLDVWHSVAAAAKWTFFILTKLSCLKIKLLFICFQPNNGTPMLGPLDMTLLGPADMALRKSNVY
jgi:hypothetical protein